jgi:hypothetical protein
MAFLSFASTAAANAAKYFSIVSFMMDLLILDN